MKHTHTTLDKILAIQLIIARLGEKELRNWWNLDIAFENGGADFIERLVGNTHQNLTKLAIADGLMQSCFNLEQKLLANLPRENGISLFVPEGTLLIELKERFRHFKKYPDDLPNEIQVILDSSIDYSEDELINMLPLESTLKPELVEGTSHGKLVKILPGWDAIQKATSYANMIVENSKSSYTLIYSVDGTL